MSMHPAHQTSPPSALQSRIYYPAPAYPVRTWASSAYPMSSAVISAGLLGTVIGGSTAMALDLHRIQEGRMTLSQAFTDSLAKGAGVGVATAAATAVARAVGGGPVLSLAVIIATATGVGYVLNSVGKSAAAKTAEDKK